MGYIKLDKDNIADEHICCAIGDKKHITGVDLKKEWIKERLDKGHVFYKLDVKGKVFIEYEPLENALVPIQGDNYLYIYCLWVSGQFAHHGYANELLSYAISDAKKQNKNGICVLSSKKKKPYLSEKSFFLKYNFKVVDNIGDYELLALSFDNALPKFNEEARIMKISNKELTVYYNSFCPYIEYYINEIKEYAKEIDLSLNTVLVDTVDKAKKLPCVFNNYAVFLNGDYYSNLVLNKNALIKLLKK